MFQRARIREVSSQRLSSQPETFGGQKSRWPASSQSQTQAPVSMGRPSARSIEASWTTGGFTIGGPS